MRASLVVSSIAGSCFGIVLASAIQSAAAQAAPAQPAPAPPAQRAPATAAPAAPAAPAVPAPTAQPQAPAAAGSPPAAAGAPQIPAEPRSQPPAQSIPGEPPGGGFDLTTALRGSGPALTADEAAKRAAQTAPSVAKAEAAARRAAVAAEQANVALYPRLDLEARYTLLSRVGPPPFVEALTAGNPGAASGFAIQQHTGLFQARLSYPVSTLFFSIIPRQKAAQKSAEAQRIQSTVQAHTVSLQARESFYNYARARAALMVAKSAQAQAEAHQRDVTALVNAGSLARVELMRADAQVAAAKVAVSRTQGSVAVGRNALYTLTHHDGTEDVTISENFEEDMPALTDTSDAVLAKALSSRSELRAVRTSLEALEHNVDAAQGQELPVLAVGGTAEYSNPNQRYFGEAKTWNGSWALFASVTWSPTDWANNGKVAEQTRADIAQTLADLEQLEDSLKLEVTQAYEDYNSAQAALASSRSGIAAADESYRVRREQFRAGSAVATDVIDSEGELRTARLDLVNAVIDMRIAKARLDRAVEAN